MFPVYTHMDPYRQTFPHQMEPNSYPNQYHPGWEVMRPQMKVESLKHPSVFAPYPFNENLCCPNSGNHGGCCHHNYSSGFYNFKPPSSHVQPAQPAPQLYYHGPYPPYPAPYPAYFVPPPHYSFDQARYDYDKARDHCCGCPNHTCHRRDDRSPKIEEQKPEKEQDRDSSGLIRLPNYPSPVVWVPTSSIKDREGDKAAQLQPGCWNGWMPVDVNSLYGSRQEDEGKEVRQDEDKWSQKRSPFPIIWMPGYEKPVGQVKDLKDITPKSVEDWPSKFKIIPVKLLENENNGERPKADHKEPKSPAQAEVPTPKEIKIKTIPVKQMEERSKKAASTPEKQKANDDEKKGKLFEKPKEESEVKTSEKKDSSPGRSSKLPPVCLRVDPLPRKKTNGTARSPSPPGDKEKRNHQQKEEQSHMRETKEEVSERVIPVVNVQDSTWSQPNKEHKCQESVSVASLKDLSKDSSVHESASLDECLKANDVIEGSKIGERDCNEKMTAGETVSKKKTLVDNGYTKSLGSEEVKEKKGMKRDLSRTDAALIIQSAYRGYEVRRWRPLEKLRKIAKVREQVGNVRRQIQRIKDSSKPLDAKERMVIGETIMSLLLELDTVQGLHPSAREARKSVARELVCLQEKLDSLVRQIAEEHEAMNVEVETKTTGEAAFAVSGADEQQSSKGESLYDKTSSTGTAVTEAAAECDVNHIDLPSNEAVDVAASSVSREPTTEQESVQPAEDISVEAELSFGNQEAGRSDAGTAIVANSSLASEPVFDQGTELSVATELPSGLVEPANKNGASENPSAESKVSESKQETLENMTKVEGPATESDGFANAPLLVGNGPCESDSSSNSLLCAGEEASKLLRGESSPILGVKGLSEPLGESGYQEQEEIPFDLRAEDDANVYHRLDDPSVETSEQGDNLGHTEGSNLAFGAGESIEENRSEPEPMSSLKQIEEDQNTKEEVPLLLPVDGDDHHIKTSVLVEGGDSKDVLSSKLVTEADTVKETMPENFEVSGFAEVAENNEGLKGFAGVSESNDNESKGVGDEIEGVIRDVHRSVDEDAVKEEGVEPATFEGHETHAIVLDVGSPAPGSATNVEAPDRNGGERYGLKNASADMNEKEKKLLEENEKLREMLERLLDAGKEQLGVMSDLNGRVRDLERKLAQRRRKIKVKRNRPAKLHPSEVVSC